MREGLTSDLDSDLYYLRLESLDEAVRNDFCVDRNEFMEKIRNSPGIVFKAYQNGEAGKRKLESDFDSISERYGLKTYGEDNSS